MCIDIWISIASYGDTIPTSNPNDCTVRNVMNRAYFCLVDFRVCFNPFYLCVHANRFFFLVSTGHPAAHSKRCTSKSSVEIIVAYQATSRHPLTRSQSQDHISIPVRPRLWESSPVGTFKIRRVSFNLRLGLSNQLRRIRIR